MNLAEFPLASLDDRVPKGQKTLVFEDQITTKGEPVTRRLTISASDKYGLPTALDDEVILGLIQLTKPKGFSDKRVNFTRYQLIQLLGWRDEGKSYQRIDESLKRWLGVSLYYDKAWWHKEEKSWVNESFHILDNVTLYDKERYERRRKSGGPDAGMSSFSWNEVVFRSFQAGYLKKLDLVLYRQFQSAVTKRLYRFTDKHFYKKPRWEFDLHTLCFEKLGMARTGHTGELKRRLDVGIRELEEHGVYRRMSDDERYRKEAPGKWTVVIEEARASNEATIENSSGLKGELIRRGISKQSADEFLREHSPTLIGERISLHDWLVHRRDKRVSKRPAGFLAQSIRMEYPLPEDYRSYVAREGNRESNVVTKKKGKPCRATEPATPRPDSDERSWYRTYIAGLTPAGREDLERRAVQNGKKLQVGAYERLKISGGELFEELRLELIISCLRSEGVDRHA